MSKYVQRGCYHFVEFATKGSIYNAHVQDLVTQIRVATFQLPRPLNVHEVGCGEGLILNQLWFHLPGLGTVSGNDADLEAVHMGKLLAPGCLITHEHDIPERGVEPRPDVVLFCDSLEHIAEWQKHLRWAQQAQCVVTAVPSEFDRHAINQFGQGAFHSLFDGWKIAHEATRHARHLTIYTR